MSFAIGICALMLVFLALGYMLFRRTPDQLAEQGRTDEARGHTETEAAYGEGERVGGPDAEDSGPHGTTFP